MKKKYWLLFIFALFIFLNKVYADEATGGHSGSDSACDSRWCWTSVGVRISLYRYDGVDLKYFGSNDYNAYRRNISNQNVKTTTKMAGKVAYQKLSGYTVSLGSSKTVSSSNTFSCFYGTKNDAGALCNSYTTTTSGEIKNYLYFNKTDDNTIISRINSLFTSANLSIGDSKNIYITVEPTMVIYKGSNYYYGTSYELLKLLSLGSIGSDGLNEVLKMKLPSSIMAQTIYGKDTNNFVGENNSSLVKRVISGPSDYNYTSWINTNKGYGIAVYWLGDVIKNYSCKDTCGSNPSIACAENYCENHETVKNYSGSIGDERKWTCMTDTTGDFCGIKQNWTTCPSTPSIGNTTSFCSEEKTSSKNTCSVKKSAYYSYKCTEKTTIKYSDDLPTIFYPGLGGFNYSVKTNGEKNCTIKFEKQPWEVAYASLKRSTRTRDALGRLPRAAQTLLDSLTGFENMSLDNYKYKFDSSDGVELKIDGEANAYKLNKLNDNTKVSTGYPKSSSDTVYYYQNKNAYSLGTYTLQHQIITNNEAFFELQKKCYSLKTGLITNIKSDGTCVEDLRNIAYYGYYTNVNKLTSNKINTKTVTIKRTSGLSDTNTCYYKKDNPDDDAYCSVEVSYGGSTATLKYSVTNRNNKAISCYFDGGIVTCPTIYPITKTVATSSKRNINSYITYTEFGKTIKKDCSVTINSGKTGENCTVKFKPVQFDAIREYCNKNWQTDVNNYSSFANCYNSCSGRDTCRTKYKCGTARITIESYCHSHYLDDGYNSYEVCVNDCICDDTKDYVYRPISLVDPFPKDREAGANWLGLEKIITNDNGDKTNTYTGKAEYIIELNEERIKAIKSDNKSYPGLENKLLEYNGQFVDGIYYSNFINKKFKHYFTCINPDKGCDVDV